MFLMNLIEPAQFEWALSVVFTLSENKKVRCYVHHRQSCTVTVEDSYSLCKIENVLTTG